MSNLSKINVTTYFAWTMKKGLFGNFHQKWLCLTVPEISINDEKGDVFDFASILFCITFFLSSEDLRMHGEKLKVDWSRRYGNEIEI